MSSKGIYTALSGAIAQSERMDTIANNLANVNTPSFKKDKKVFQEYLTAYEKEPAGINVPRVPASIESFYDHQGGDKSYVDVAGTFTDFTQGALKPTNNTLDWAIEGDGFFEVQTRAGSRLTRNGSFTLNPQGYLVTKEGHFVLKKPADPNTEDQGDRRIQLTKKNVSITETGEIFQDGESVGEVSFLKVNDARALKKVGSSLYGLKELFGPQKAFVTNAKIHQGFVEQSNVNVVSEMTNMISATRSFESTQRAIKAYDQMNDKLVNVIPKIR